MDVVVNDLLNQKILSQEYEGAKIVCDPFTHAENAIAVQKGKDDLLAFINECIDEYYADGTYDTLWTKWIDASGEGEEAAAAEDAETAELNRYIRLCRKRVAVNKVNSNRKVTVHW